MVRYLDFRPVSMNSEVIDETAREILGPSYFLDKRITKTHNMLKRKVNFSRSCSL